MYGYAATVCVAFGALQLLTDRTELVTLFAFGPRWLVVLPLPAIVAIVLMRRPARTPVLLGVLLAITPVIAGIADFRVGGGTGGPPSLRLLTQNLGGSTVTAAKLDEFLTQQHVDVAALQECPFYDFGPMRFGWYFYYGGDLCVVSRYPFSVLDFADPDREWERPGRRPVRVEVASPAGNIQLLNVHLETVRGGIEALQEGWWAGFRRNRQGARVDSAAARARLLPSSTPFVVAGDFNLPVESAIYKQYWGDLGNSFSRCGRGFGYTKFTSIYAIRIDHILVSDQWECAAARVLDSPYGGDHAPLIADLRLRH